MAKKNDQLFFENFVDCAACACRAATMLEDVLENFDSRTLPRQVEQMHLIEHEGDTKKHEMMEALMHAFITPIEREDIILLSHDIDEVTDCIEDVLLHLYMNNITFIHPEAVRFSKLLIRCCEVVQLVMKKFQNFKKETGLRQLIIELNAFEEEGDRLFISAMRKLHTECKDPLEIIAWREIYIYLEKCVDACEHVADVVETVIMKNT